MHAPYSAFADLPDDQLLAEVTRLAARERQATADLVASLVVLDARRLYLREGYPSLFAYSTGALHLAEGAAYLRIEAARAVRRFPTILDRLAAGAITLTGIKLLAPHLTEANHLGVLDAAHGRTTREIEQLVAQLSPRPDVPAVVRKLPVRQVDSAAPSSPSAHAPLAPHIAAAANQASPVAGPAATPAALDFAPPRVPAAVAPPAVASTAVPPPRAVVLPLAPERYKVQMTIGAETHERLRRAQALLRHTIPDGDLVAIFDQALVLLLERLERRKWGARKARRAAGDPAKPPGAHAEPRKARRPTSRDANASGMLTAGATAGAAQPPGGGSGAGSTTCAAIPHREQTAGRAAGAGELVAKRVGAADEHALRSRTDPALSESKAGVPCALVTRAEPPAWPAAGTGELVAQRVRAADEHAVQPGPEALSRSKTGRHASRRIPAAVRRAVWLRANGQCTYVSPSGQRCPARSRLEFHHAVPYADGGQAGVEGITLLCAAHHARETERWFGERPRRGGKILGP